MERQPEPELDAGESNDDRHDATRDARGLEVDGQGKTVTRDRLRVRPPDPRRIALGDSDADLEGGAALELGTHDRTAHECEERDARQEEERQGRAACGHRSAVSAASIGTARAASPAAGEPLEVRVR